MVQAQKSLEKDLNAIENVHLVKLKKKWGNQVIPTKKFSIIIPALNEEHTIKKLVQDVEQGIKELVSEKDFEILVIDDGSKDLTFKNASEVRTARVFKNERNMGKGYSMRKGVKYAEGKYVAFIDADGSHSVKDLVKGFKIIEKIEKNQVSDRAFLITGVRFKNDKHGTTVLNKVGNKLYSLIALTLWKKNINDLTCGLRFAKRSDLLNMNLTSSRYTIEVEMIAESLRKKYTVIQIPINATQRMYGSSGIRAMKEGIIIPISFVLASLNIFSAITRKISI